MDGKIKSFPTSHSQREAQESPNQRRDAMSLIRPFSSIREDFNRLFRELDSEFFTTPLALPGRGQGEQLQTFLSPAVDVIDEEKNILVKAQIPGIKPENIDIDVENNTLTLTGETTEKFEDTQKQGNLVRQEISYGRSFRRIPLPADVNGEKAQAEFEHGVLTIKLPKSEETRRHKIKVQKR
jgi:HSP20 family protein